jgi:mono/diheme cytochrome c family protein
MRFVIIPVFSLALALVLVGTFRAAHSGHVQSVTASSTSILNVIGDTDHDLGVVNLGDSAIVTYTLRNTGKESVHISSLHPSCGCTAAIVDSDNINPGGYAHIKATFNSIGKAEGNFSKTITVATNSTIKANLKLGFHGLLKMPATPHAGSVMHLTGIFDGKCGSCHSWRGRGQLGGALWKADCALCHTEESNAPHSIDDARFSGIAPAKFERIVHEGIRGKNMPAFALKHGGPLTDQQITSLREFFEWKLTHKGNL